MLKDVFLQIISSIAGLQAAVLFVSEVEFKGKFTTLFIAGAILGLLNYFVKPVLKTLTFPIRIITLNLFSAAISMGLIWLVDLITPDLIIVKELTIKGFSALAWTAVIILIVSKILSSVAKKINNPHTTNKN